MNENCNDPDLGSMLHAYEIGALSDEDAERFEVHLLKCRSCFSKALHFSSQAELLRRDRTIREEVDQAVKSRTAPQTIGQKFRKHLWPAAAVVVIGLLIYPAWVGLEHLGDPQIRPVETIELYPTRSASPEFPDPAAGIDVVHKIAFDTDAANKDFVILFLGAENDTLDKLNVRSGPDSTVTAKLTMPNEIYSRGPYRVILADTVGGPRIVQDGYSIDWRK